MGTFTVIVFSLTRNFKIFMIAGFGFGVLIMICMFLFVPESPRYYVATNQNIKALGVYKYLASLHPDKEVKRKINRLEERVRTEGHVLKDDDSNEVPFKE